MAGSVFAAGESKTRPGPYVRVINADPPATSTPSGIVAAILKATWGPLGVATVVETIEALKEKFGSGLTTAVAKEALKGAASKLVVYRLGTGGAKGTLNLKDTTPTTPVDVVRIDAKYVGTFGNDLKVQVRDHLVDSTKRELLVYEGTALRETFAFTKGGSDEALALATAVSDAGSSLITATKLAIGNGTLATLAATALAGGTDPTVVTADYSTALSGVETEEWDVLVADTEDAAIHTTIKTYVDRVRNEGKRIMAVVGEPTSVALATRQANAKALNHAAVVYVGNGFLDEDEAAVEGYKAAGRMGGMIASAPVTRSLTHALPAGATGLKGALTGLQIEDSIKSGMLVFSLNARRQVQVEYGITSLVTLAANQDAGWKKIRRTRTRDNLINRVMELWDPLTGQVNNDKDGRATLTAAAQGVVNELIAEKGLISGTVYEDPANAPAGDSATWRFDGDDLDSVEKLYITFGFRFSAS